MAVLGDTHGNRTAFAAVLVDVHARNADQIIHLGDIAGKGPSGALCCDLTREHCSAVVRGNWDVFLQKPPDQLPVPSRWWRAEVGEANLAWFASLPFCHDFTMAGLNIRAYHASADSVFHRVYPTVEGEEWDALFRNTPETGDGPAPDIAIYGDIHWVWQREQEGRTIINAGSVGNPLDEPVPSYLLLDDDTGELRREIIRVPYDIEAELAVARAVGMPQYDFWEQELRTAVYAR